MRRVNLLAVAALFAALIVGVGYAQTSTLTPHAPIYISGNAAFTPANGVVSGSGTMADPYIIERWEINAAGSKYGIYVENTDAYFIIRVCWVYGADLGGPWWEASGISLLNVKNGMIAHCKILSNTHNGIALRNSSNNRVFRNTIESNGYNGIGGGYGDIMLENPNNQISNNVIATNKRCGIEMGGPSNEISKNIVLNNQRCGIGLRGVNNKISENSIYDNGMERAGVGVGLLGTGNEISMNTIVNNPFGVYLNPESSTNEISMNTIIVDKEHEMATCHRPGCPVGIKLEGSSNNKVSENIVLGHWAGVWGVESSNNEMVANMLMNEIGIYLEGSSNNFISKNLISRGWVGILLRKASANNEISGNTIQWHTPHPTSHGIWLVDSSGNRIYHNNLIENTTNAEDNGTNQWDDGTLGNYWSDYWFYGGTDQNGDGIGDIPYDILGGANQDRYPKMEPFPSP